MNHARRWHFWVVNRNAGVEPPEEWETIIGYLSPIINGAYIDKIEVAAFTIRGKRTARWRVAVDHSEFATLENSLGAAKKLTWLLLRSEGSPEMPSGLYDSLKCTKSTECRLLEGHSNGCETRVQGYENLRCPVCLETVNLADYERDGRTDPLSMQMGHLVPLSRTRHGHNAANVVWVHRRCNYIQDEQTVEDTIRTLCDIVRRHGYEVSTLESGG